MDIEASSLRVKIDIIVKIKMLGFLNNNMVPITYFDAMSNPFN